METGPVLVFLATFSTLAAASNQETNTFIPDRPLFDAIADMPV